MFNILTIDKIRKIEVESTTYCNAGCPHCSRHVMNTSILEKNMPMSHLPYECIEKLKDDFGEQTKIMDIWYIGNLGDSLMHPDMEKIWEFTIKHFRYTEIETNGGARKTDFWKNMGEISKKSGQAMMCFSIDGLEDTNEIYRKKVKWDRLMENVHAYISAGGIATWKWLTFSHNEHQVEEARELARKLGFAKFDPMYSSRYEKKTYEAVPKTESIEEKRKVKYIHKVLKNSEIQLSSNVSKIIEEKMKELKFDTSVPKIDCKYIKQKRMYLNAKGRVWPCCWHSEFDKFSDFRYMDPLVYPHYINGFNDYTTKSLPEIFAQPAWKEITDTWEKETLNKYGKRKMAVCYRACVNKKWEVTCNLRDVKARSVFKEID